MLQKREDIWTFRQPGDWICITTCGVVKQDGRLVMGRGIALEASKRYPGLSKTAGALVSANGLKVEALWYEKLILFPTKYHYKDKSDINLILRSTIQLIDVFNSHGWEDCRVLLPRVGTGNGGLDWAEVEPLLAHYLVDDRFIIFHYQQSNSPKAKF
jgi:hypothetical protein